MYNQTKFSNDLLKHKRHQYDIDKKLMPFMYLTKANQVLFLLPTKYKSIITTIMYNKQNRIDTQRPREKCMQISGLHMALFFLVDLPIIALGKKLATRPFLRHPSARNIMHVCI